MDRFDEPSSAVTTGVLAMAYGTPRAPEEIESFYTDIRRGLPPSAEQLAELSDRYAAIGGLSPLTERTTAQVRALGAALDAIAPGTYEARFGARHAEPKIETTIGEMAEQGLARVIGIVLAPHYSRLSVGAYIERARAAAGAAGMSSAFVERWGTDDALIALLARRVAEATAELDLTGPTALVVTAHSLPEVVRTDGDGYVEQVEETASLLGAATGITTVQVAWQSAGRTGDPWIGPTLAEALRELAGSGTEAVVVCPAGFTSDHLEILYDLDIEARMLAESLDLRFARTASLNDDPALAALLARRVIAADLAGAA